MFFDYYYIRLDNEVYASGFRDLLEALRFADRHQLRGNIEFLSSADFPLEEEAEAAE
jgi:hypothetical protein